MKKPFQTGPSTGQWVEKTVIATVVLVATATATLSGCADHGESINREIPKGASSTLSEYERCLAEARAGYRSGDFALVEKSFKKAIDEANKFDSKDPRAANAYINLATAYQEQGKYKEARPLFEKALQLDESNGGKEHVSVARDAGLLAINYQTQGMFAQAEPLWKRTIAIMEKTIGPTNSNTATAMFGLARNLRAQGKMKEAEPYYLKSVVIDGRESGGVGGKVFGELSEIASFYHELKKYNEADKCYKRMMDIGPKIFGPHHPELIKRKTMYAKLLREMGRESEAQKYDTKESAKKTKPAKKTEPVKKAEPAKTEPAKTEPTKTAPAKTAPAPAKKAEPTKKAEPVKKVAPPVKN